MSDRQIRMTFQWTSGAKVTFTTWDGTEPNGFVDGVQNCVYMATNVSEQTGFDDFIVYL